MTTEITGVVRGKTIALDAPIPPLDGVRVRITLEPADADFALPDEEQDRFWREWVDHGPQGPLDNEATWPDEA
jgi:hypothetical protein